MGSVGSLPRRFPLFSFFCLLVSSVSDFRPDTRGAVVDPFFFLGSLVQSRCGEGGMLQITLACARSVSATLGMPLHTAHTAQALRCSAGICLRPALGCMHLPGLSRSGRLSGSPQRRRFSWACVLCPSQDRADQVFGERGRCDLSPFPAAQFSGCTAGAPCQADGDCPEPQEVLVSKEACLQFGR